MRIALSIAVALACSGLLFGAVLSESAPAFAPSYTKTFDPGVYRCASCGAELFRSEDKFASTTRWPSFRACAPGAVAEREDRSEGLDRTEVLCARCGAHLGHVFPDGALAGDTSPDARLRYCVLSSSLRFEPGAVVRTPTATLTRRTRSPGQDVSCPGLRVNSVDSVSSV